VTSANIKVIDQSAVGGRRLSNPRRLASRIKEKTVKYQLPK
jgi:hypothetical protein